MESLHPNRIWQLAQFPARKKTLQNKWVYWLKQESDVKKRGKLTVKEYVDADLMMMMMRILDEAPQVMSILWVQQRGLFADTSVIFKWEIVGVQTTFSSVLYQEFGGESP
ncbi:hypothetical protein AXG93_3114s1000 [Marchantia polymorpha subsp. ruderalis]|uniref:Uncharacterized protein n=1 Tax=Marchantia polymorpha subsp. ruderalis TaxID=1480154 RepID=A0A176W826_MARPO|nr:hypothetical protein AXG93_3114s1000 [Marchantia polymorpha subsp. ruderalis]